MPSPNHHQISTNLLASLVAYLERNYPAEQFDATTAALLKEATDHINDGAEVATLLEPLNDPNTPSCADLSISKIKEASQAAADGSINAVIEVSWRFVATLGLEKDDIQSLSNESLRAMLGEHVDEMIAGTSNTGDAIEIEALLEARDGDTDRLIPLN